jgi:hypothetical protein
LLTSATNQTDDKPASVSRGYSLSVVFIFTAKSDIDSFPNQWFARCNRNDKKCKIEMLVAVGKLINSYSSGHCKRFDCGASQLSLF